MKCIASFGEVSNPILPRKHGRSLSALVLCAWMLPSVALAFNLISAKEAEDSARQEVAYPMPETAAKAFDPMAPRIEVLSPNLAASVSVQSPLAIRVKFQPMGDSQVIPESFRAHYGAFRIDITDRLLKATKVTKEGIQVEKAELPTGSHRLFLKIQDNADRTGEREVKFSVQ